MVIACTKELTRVVNSYEIYQMSLFARLISVYEMVARVRFCSSYDL